MAIANGVLVNMGVNVFTSDAMPIVFMLVSVSLCSC